MTTPAGIIFHLLCCQFDIKNPDTTAVGSSTGTSSRVVFTCITHATRHNDPVVKLTQVMRGEHSLRIWCERTFTITKGHGTRHNYTDSSPLTRMRQRHTSHSTAGKAPQGDRRQTAPGLGGRIASWPTAPCGGSAGQGSHILNVTYMQYTVSQSVS